MESNLDILGKKEEKKSKEKDIKKENEELEKSSSDFNSEVQNPANVLSFGGEPENPKKKDKTPQKDSKGLSQMENSSDMLDFTDSNANAYSQFSIITKMKYYYLKHEWTFIAIRELIAIGLIVLSFILYSSSLKVENNYHNYNIYFYYPMTLASSIKCISAGVIIGFIIFFMYIKLIFLEHIIYIAIVYIILITKNFGTNILNHGKYNFIVFSISSLLIILVLLSIYMIYRFFRTIKYLYLIIAILALIFCFLIYYIFTKKYKKTYSCENWDKTLNSTYIYEDIDSKCNIQKPKGFCYMNKIYNYFDLTLANQINCSNRNENEYNNFLKALKNENLSSVKIFGFPYTNNLNRNFITNETKNINDYIFNNLINLENSTMTSETILDFSKNKFGDLKINFTKNITLSNLRKNIALNNLKNQKESIYDNILLILLSSTSRAHFQRAMPKLSKFISKLMGYEPFPIMTAYQYSKFYNFPFIEQNIQSMFYKKTVNNSYINSLKYFKENGYITGKVIDKCEKKVESLDTNEIEWDHENYAYLCDPNYYKEKYSTYERCLYGKPVSEYMINYTLEFWDKYFDNKKYFNMVFNYGDEPTGNVLSYLDEPLFNMLSHLYNNGKLKNTAVFIVSEQGNKNNGLYDVLGSAEFELEKKYGLFIIILDWNDKFKNGNYHKNLIKNQNIFTTPYDIYESMMHIVLGNLTYSKTNIEKMVNYEGESMFNEIHIENRFCGKMN